jgi:hypothetical protein
MCQGNGATAAGWTVTSIAMIWAHKRKGHGVHLTRPIIMTSLHLVGTLFINDTDIEHFDMTKVETVQEVHEALQNSIHNCGRILVATGGELKPAKFFYHLISFIWKPDGTWQYDTNDQKPALSIMVPLEDGTQVAIKHLSVATLTKTLGEMTCPTGSSIGAQMKETAQGWIAKAQLSKLHKRNLWFFLDKQFWPWVSFGISIICAPFAVLE